MAADPVTPTPARFPASGVDALPPAAMARKAEDIGRTKASLDLATMVALSVLAGAFIAMGAVFATTVTTGAGDLPFGVAAARRARLLAVDRHGLDVTRVGRRAAHPDDVAVADGVRDHRRGRQVVLETRNASE